MDLSADARVVTAEAVVLTMTVKLSAPATVVVSLKSCV